LFASLGSVIASLPDRRPRPPRSFSWARGRATLPSTTVRPFSPLPPSSPSSKLHNESRVHKHEYLQQNLAFIFFIFFKSSPYHPDAKSSSSSTNSRGIFGYFGTSSPSSTYPGCFSLLYLVITAVGFYLIVSVVPYCQVKCPLLIQGTNFTLNYQSCLCNVTGGITNAQGYLPDADIPANDSGSFQQQLNRYNLIYQATIPVNKNCYICPSDSDPSVYQACSSFSECTQTNLLGFRPASFSGNTMCVIFFVAISTPFR